RDRRRSDHDGVPALRPAGLTGDRVRSRRPAHCGVGRRDGRLAALAGGPDLMAEHTIYTRALDGDWLRVECACGEAIGTFTDTLIGRALATSAKTAHRL